MATDKYCPGRKISLRWRSIAAFARDSLAGDYGVCVERAGIHLITVQEAGGFASEFLRVLVWVSFVSQVAGNLPLDNRNDDERKWRADYG
jgi:hypothetical protein